MSELLEQAKKLASGKHVADVSTTRGGFRRVSTWWLSCMADRLECLESSLEHILRLQEEHDGEPFEEPMMHAEAIARDALRQD